MPEGTANESAHRGIGFWVMMMLGAVVVLYLLGFTVLVLFPRASRAAQAMGLSEDTLEKIYYPILRFLR
jgi:biotin transporter BioY